MVTTRKTTDYLRALYGADNMHSERFPALPPESAALLRTLVTIRQPKRILEIGTCVGSSGMEMLSAAPEAQLYTVEADEDKALLAAENFRTAGYGERAHILKGRAEDILPYMTGTFDFVLIDGPKGQYGAFFALIDGLIEVGGVLCCDNILFRGMVTGDRKTTPRKATLVKKLDAFLRMLAADNRYETAVLPVGDGISVSVKK